MRVPASGSEQLRNSYILAFTAADLGPEQFDCRRSPAVERGVEFVRDYLRAGTKHCREVGQRAPHAILSHRADAANRRHACHDKQATLC